MLVGSTLVHIGTRLFIGSLALALTGTALAPLFGMSTLIYSLSLADEPVATNFIVIRCATFATLAYFSVNFLRRKRPLSSVAPMLVFCNFTVFFGAALMLQRSQFDVMAWATLVLIGGVSVFLYRENRAQNKVIFRDGW